MTIESKILNTNAHQNPSIKNPGTNELAINTKIVLITNKNNPNVNIVMGMVKMTKTGLTKTLSKARIPATTIAIIKPSTWAPGNTVEQIKTANADSNNLMIKLFILIFFEFKKV